MFLKLNVSPQAVVEEKKKAEVERLANARFEQLVEKTGHNLLKE